jgi:putative ABC transport system ATP-binding protein
VFVHGRSGTGKSTLLNLLAGILSSKQGSIDIFGQSLSALSARQRDAFRAQHIGMVFQQFNLVSYLSVLENIQLAAHFAATSSEVVKQRCIELFNCLKLDIGLLNRSADTLSVGQQQRVAIVRALINQPRLLIVDEPTSALDSEAKAGFMQLLMSLIEQADTTLIFVSHDETLRPFFSRHISMSDLNCLDAEHVN